MQGPVARSETRKIIVHAVTSHMKVRSPKMQNKKYRAIGLSKWGWGSINDFFLQSLSFENKKKTKFFFQ